MPNPDCLDCAGGGTRYWTEGDHAVGLPETSHQAPCPCPPERRIESNPGGF